MQLDVAQRQQHTANRIARQDDNRSFKMVDDYRRSIAANFPSPIDEHRAERHKYAFTDFECSQLIRFSRALQSVRNAPERRLSTRQPMARVVVAIKDAVKSSTFGDRR